MKNKLHYPFLLCLTVIGLLLLLSRVPQFSYGSFTFRKIDILSDIRPAPTDSIRVKTEIAPAVVAKQDSIVSIIKEHCKPGLTCIEDYSKHNTALKYFFQALQKTEKSGTSLRIAFYGDSFIEGDVFCGSFRDTLQSIFGGRGVGYVPITSEVSGFRNTIKHNFENWQTFSLIKPKDSSVDIGPSGFSFIPLEGNRVEYKPSKQRYLREFNTVKLYYKNLKDAVVLHYSIDAFQSADTLNSAGKLKEWKYLGNQFKSVSFEFNPFDSLLVFGTSFENGSGIYVDNFALRGNSGMNLTRIKPELYKQFNYYRKYKLIILQFGLNLIVEENLNYQAYARRMIKVINNLKKLFPECSFLLLGISDRSSNVSGTYKTMQAIPAMLNAQRLIAKETHIAFWDMYQAMGGENSMVKFSEAKPPLAAKDYTHLNFKGGKKLASSLVKSLLFERTKHEKK